MAGKRIPDLDPLSGAASANDDKLVIYDSSTTTTKRIDRSQLAAGLVGDLPYTPSGGISATTIPTAIAELDSEAAKSAALAASGGAGLVGRYTVPGLLASTEAARGAGAIWYADDFRYAEAASGATDHHIVTAGGVKLYVLPGGDGYVSQRAFGAVGNGVTDDTVACQAAHNAGLPIRDNGVFAVSALTAKASVSGCKYVRTSGSNAFVTTGADGIVLDCEIDAQNIGTHGLVIGNDKVTTAPTFVVRNCNNNGIDARDANKLTLQGDIYDCKQIGCFVGAIAADVYGLRIDLRVDNSSLGADNLNGGVKVQAWNGFSIHQPEVKANVTLWENALVPTAAVGIEVWTDGTGGTIFAPKISGMVTGGNIGFTAQNCPGGTATVVSRGAKTNGLELASSENFSLFGAAVAGETVTPTTPIQFSGSCHGSVSHANSVGAAAGGTNANIYVNLSNGCRIYGTHERATNGPWLRVRGSKNLMCSIKGRTKSGGTAPDYAILLDTISGASPCDGLKIEASDFDQTSRAVEATGTYDDILISATRFRNTSAIIFSGSPTLTNTRFLNGTRFDTHPFGARWAYGDVLSYVQGGASLLDGVSTGGTPAGWVIAAVGSRIVDPAGGAGTTFYLKESGTSSSGWVGK